MKFLHIADLHFGKTLHGLSLTESGDQRDWMEKFLALTERERPDAVLIAGDVYDRSAPSNEAVLLLDELLTRLAACPGCPAVLMVAGNHDSGCRLGFARKLLKKQNIFIAGVPEPEVAHVTLTDQFGPVTFWLVPYLFPTAVNQILGTDLHDYTAAMRELLQRQGIDFSARNVLIAHQNVTCNGQEAERGGSETMVGGVGGIDCGVFDGFDYVALGHIHAAQPVGRPEVRYAGSPLCYHFSETRHANKGPVLVELGEKGSPAQIEVVPIAPLHPMAELTGTEEELIALGLSGVHQNEYLRLVLTQPRRGAETDAALRAVFEQTGNRVLEIAVEAPRPHAGEGFAPAQAVEEKSMEQLFCDFCQERTRGTPDAGTLDLLKFILEKSRNTDEEDAPPTEQDLDAIVRFAQKQEAEQ